MAQEKDGDSFHDSESEDIFDLFNACDGKTRKDGLLEIRMLDEFSEEEAAALNVVRLKEIWNHTASGCPQCAAIISTLKRIRGTLSKKDVEELLKEQESAIN